MTSQAQESLSVSIFKAARTNVRRIAAELTEAGATITYAAPVVRGNAVIGLDIRGETRDASGRRHLTFNYYQEGSAVVFNAAFSTTAGFAATHEELLAAIRTWSTARLTVDVAV